MRAGPGLVRSSHDACACVRGSRVGAQPCMVRTSLSATWGSIAATATAAIPLLASPHDLPSWPPSEGLDLDTPAVVHSRCRCGRQAGSRARRSSRRRSRRQPCTARSGRAGARGRAWGWGRTGPDGDCGVGQAGAAGWMGAARGSAGRCVSVSTSTAISLPVCRPSMPPP